MTERRSDPPFEPWNQTGPEMAPLSRDVYPEDSLGHAYFPEILEGRMRPIGTLDFPLPGNKATVTFAALNAQGVTTYAELLAMPEAQLAEMPPSIILKSNKFLPAAQTGS